MAARDDRLGLRRTKHMAALSHRRLGLLFETALAPGSTARLLGPVLHIRAPEKITLEAAVSLSPKAAPCRLQVPSDSRVVQTGIGRPDSRLNNAVYDPDTDLALSFEAVRVRIESQSPGSFRVGLRDAHEVCIRVKENHLRSLCPYLPKGPVSIKPPAPTGWLSYYCHFERPREDTILEDLEVAAGLVDYGFSFFLVEAWQKNALKLPVYNFHNEAVCDRAKFPRGMKWLADRIREKGLRPGIWYVSLGTGNPKVFKRNPDMFIRDAAGAPIRDWSGLYMFDPTHPDAQKHIAEQLRILADDWGYEFFKLDGLSGRPDHLCEWFYSQPHVRARFSRKRPEPFRDTVRLIRRALGPRRYFHCCAGYYNGAAVGPADGARTGGDVFFSGQGPSWSAIRKAASVVLDALFTNRYVWHADPDILSVRRPLTLDQARAWATLFGITGVFLASSDRLATLPKSRLDILKRVLPAADILPMDLAPCKTRVPIWGLAVKKPFAEWNVAALFNWESDRPLKEALRFSELGLSVRATYLVFDFWNQRFLGRHRGRINLRIPPQSCRVLAIHPKLGRPQLVSASRHITQGAVSIRDLCWDPEALTLSGTSDLVADDPYDLYIHVPSRYGPVAVDSDARKFSLTTPSPSLLRVRLADDRTGPRRWHIRFAGSASGPSRRRPTAAAP